MCAASVTTSISPFPTFDSGTEEVTLPTAQALLEEECKMLEEECKMLKKCAVDIVNDRVPAFCGRRVVSGEGIWWMETHHGSVTTQHLCGFF